MERVTTASIGCLCCPEPRRPLSQAEDKQDSTGRCEYCWHWYQQSEMYNPTKGVYVCQVCWF